LKNTKHIILIPILYFGGFYNVPIVLENCPVVVLKEEIKDIFIITAIPPVNFVQELII